MPHLRRFLVALAVATACLLPVATTNAAPRGGRQEALTVRAAEPRGLFRLWSLLTALWQEAGVRIDNNGGE